MVVISRLVLVCRNARDKVQIAITSLSQEANTFYIERSTGQFQGKMVEQPVLEINRGKAKRSVLQQAQQEFNSIVKKYLDKGYKRLDSLTDDDFEDLTLSEIDELVPSVKSDQSGNLKPMLAKSSTQCQNSVLNKPMWNSRKLNGVRMLVKFSGEEDLVKTISRGGQHYDCAAKLITDELYTFLKENPSYVLDGEMYIHGEYLQTISGMARLETWEPRCERLEYWIYDLAIPNMIFQDRLEILKDMQDYFKDSIRIKVIDHVFTESWAGIQKLHDKWVDEGFEGLVARKPDKVYGFGKRGSDMIKCKDTVEDSFLITGYEEKLRDEDFCFICQTKDGLSFEAKPIGTRAMKDEYLANMDDIIGRMGDVKYFELSKEGKPLQTRFIAVRYDID